MVIQFYPALCATQAGQKIVDMATAAAIQMIPDGKAVMNGMIIVETTWDRSVMATSMTLI